MNFFETAFDLKLIAEFLVEFYLNIGFNSANSTKSSNNIKRPYFICHATFLMERENLWDNYWNKDKTKK